MAGPLYLWWVSGWACNTVLSKDSLEKVSWGTPLPRDSFWSLLLPSCWNAGVQMRMVEQEGWKNNASNCLSLNILVCEKTHFKNHSWQGIFVAVVTASQMRSYNLRNPMEIPKCINMYVQRFTGKALL